MHRVLNDLKIMILTNLWIVPVVGVIVWALFQFVPPPPQDVQVIAVVQQVDAVPHAALVV